MYFSVLIVLCFIGKMSRMPCRTQDPLQWRAGLPHQRHAPKIPRATHRDNRGITGPDQWSNYGKMQRVFRKSLLQFLQSL